MVRVADHEEEVVHLLDGERERDLERLVSHPPKRRRRRTTQRPDGLRRLVAGVRVREVELHVVDGHERRLRLGTPDDVVQAPTRTAVDENAHTARTTRCRRAVRGARPRSAPGGRGAAVSGPRTFAGVDVDVKTNPKMGDLEKYFAQTSRSRVEMSTGSRISPNDIDLSEGEEKKDSGERTSPRSR